MSETVQSWKCCISLGKKRLVSCRDDVNCESSECDISIDPKVAACLSIASFIAVASTVVISFHITFTTCLGFASGAYVLEIHMSRAKIHTSKAWFAELSQLTTSLERPCESTAVNSEQANHFSRVNAFVAVVVVIETANAYLNRRTLAFEASTLPTVLSHCSQESVASLDDYHECQRWT